jgi:hypothetical protein
MLRIGIAVQMQDSTNVRTIFKTDTNFYLPGINSAGPRWHADTWNIGEPSRPPREARYEEIRFAEGEN